MCKFVRNIFSFERLKKADKLGTCPGCNPAFDPKTAGIGSSTPVTMPARDALTENGWMDDMETLSGSKGQNNKHLFAL